MSSNLIVDLVGRRKPFLGRLRAGFLVFLPLITAVLFFLTRVQKDITVWDLSFRIAMSGLVGFYTNWIAIKMLFHPKEPMALSKWQGLIPKNKGKLAVQMGKEVQEKLLSPEVISEYVSDQRLFEKGSAYLLRKIRSRVDSLENRQRIRDIVGGFIQRTGKENLEQFVQKTVNFALSFIQNKKNIQKLLSYARDTFEKALGNHKLRNSISNLIDRLSSGLLKDDGPISALISHSIVDLKAFLKQKSTRKSIGDFLLHSLRNLKESHLDDLTTMVLGKLEKRLANYMETGKVVDAVSKWLSSILTKPGVVDFVAREVCTLLEKNSDSLGKQLAEMVKEKNIFLKIFTSDKSYKNLLYNMGRSDEFRLTIRDMLEEKADISHFLRTSGARIKLIKYLSANRKTIVTWCMKSGVPLLEKLIDSAVSSEEFWDFLIGMIDKFSEELDSMARKYLPLVMKYIRESLQRQHVGEAILEYFARNESVFLEKATAPETAEKVNNYIIENKDALSEFIEDKLRPHLTVQAERLLSSEAFWDWLDSQVNKMIPMASIKLRKFVQSDYAKRKLGEILPKLSSSISIGEIVEQQVSKFSTDDLEDMVDSVSGENLAGIEIFGGVLGLAAGTITIINESWQPAVVVFGVFALWLIAETVAKRTRKPVND